MKLFKKKTKKKKHTQNNNQNNNQNKNQNNNQNKNQNKNQSKKKKYTRLRTKKPSKMSFLKRFLRKKSKRINSLFNNKDIINMINYIQDDDNTFTKEDNRCMCIDYEVNNNNTNMENNQDYRRCNNKVKKGSDFCTKHQDCQSILNNSNTNGSEIPYTPADWDHPYIQGTHNCYSYLLNDRQDSLKEKCDKICKKKYNNCPRKIKSCSNYKPQPGHHFFLMNNGNLKNKNKNKKYTCPSMEKKIKQDNSSILNSSFMKQCPNNYYKGAMVVDDNNTFHFYRMDKDGTWSHKPGTQKVSNKDASGKQIYIPHFADRDYSHKPNKIKYNSFCNYYCIPNNNHITTNSI
jgi:hypothetical protein